MVDEETTEILKKDLLKGIEGLKNIDPKQIVESKDVEAILKTLWSSNPGLVNKALDRLNIYYLRVHIKTALMLGSFMTGVVMIATSLMNMLNLGWGGWLGAGTILSIIGAIPTIKIFKKKE
jgi:hypothetical protein